jgi:hypothetical protein
MNEAVILNSREIVENVILRELKTIIYSPETASAPYIKFILIANSIEYLGACGDKHPFEETGHSEERFKDALTKFFPSNYNQFAKADSPFYLYEKFRCPMLHAFRPSDKIDLTERNRGHHHLQVDKEKQKLYLVLEDFYDDLEKAAKKFVEAVSKGTIPDKTKVEKPFLRVGPNSGATESNLTV